MVVARKEDMSGDLRRIKKEDDVMLATILLCPVVIIFTYGIMPSNIHFILRVIISFFLLYGGLSVMLKLRKQKNNL